jgi:hypothetical protein
LLQSRHLAKTLSRGKGAENQLSRTKQKENSFETTRDYIRRSAKIESTVEKGPPASAGHCFSRRMQALAVNTDAFSRLLQIAIDCP